MTKDEKPTCTICGTKLIIKYIFTERHQYTENMIKFNIPKHHQSNLEIHKKIKYIQYSMQN